MCTILMLFLGFRSRVLHQWFGIQVFCETVFSQVCSGPSTYVRAHEGNDLCMDIIYDYTCSKTYITFVQA